MMTVWVVVGVFALGAVTVAVVVRRHAQSVEPAVREFAEFRDALSRHVAGFPAIPGNDRHSDNGRPDHRRTASSHDDRERDGLDQTRH